MKRTCILPHFRLFVAFPLLMLLAVLPLRALTLCSHCAYEQGETANFCTHCGNRLRPEESTEGRTQPEPADAPLHQSTPDSPPHPTPPEAAALVREAVRTDVLLGRELMASGRPDVARAVLANALAMSAVDPGALTPQQGEQLLSEIRQCEQQLSQSSIPCSACDGSGRRSMRFEHLTGESGSLVASGQACLTCRGSGQTRRTRSSEDLQVLLGQAQRQKEQALRSRGRTPVGGAWVPPGLLPLLDLRMESRLRKAAAASCASCQGIGRTDCRRCTNTGFVPCPGRGCDQGLVIREALNRLDPRTALRRREPCGTCAGSARVTCTDCRGTGALVCRSCGGTGKRPPCTACGGEGIASCRPCRGQGTHRDGSPCRDCAQEGQTLCPTCRGEGTRSR